MLKFVFLKDSLVIEDPTLKSDEQPVKINLQKYLVTFFFLQNISSIFWINFFLKRPFDVNLDKHGVYRVQSENKTNTLKVFQRAQEFDEKSIESFLSSLPGSFLETPRENPLADLKLVDLTLGSKINQLDLRSYLIDWLTECECPVLSLLNELIYC